jgi:hypothetical protein
VKGPAGLRRSDIDNRIGAVLTKIRELTKTRPVNHPSPLVSPETVAMGNNASTASDGKFDFLAFGATGCIEPEPARDARAVDGTPDRIKSRSRRSKRARRRDREQKEAGLCGLPQDADLPVGASKKRSSGASNTMKDLDSESDCAEHDNSVRVTGNSCSGLVDSSDDEEIDGSGETPDLQASFAPTVQVRAPHIVS